MTTAQERMKILKMVADGKITAEEAAKLLSAITKSEKQEPASGTPKWLRVKVTDIDSGKQQVNVNLPFEMVQIGVRMGARFVPEMDGMEIEELLKVVKAGVTGKIADIIDDEDGQRIMLRLEGDYIYESDTTSIGD
jgi:hypothetical protein